MTRAEWWKAYYAAHRAELIERQKAYYAAHRDERIAYTQRWVADHREERRQYVRQHSKSDVRLLGTRLNFHTAPPEIRDLALTLRAARAAVRKGQIHD